jgi:hypothetical protein
MSEAIELYKKTEEGNFDPSGVFYCSECRVVYRAKDEAEWCHGERLCACGKKVTQGYFQRTCSECESKEWRDKQTAKEAERFEKAKKIKASEYTGDHVYLGDSYYDSVEEAIDEFLEGQEPEYVWACTDHGIQKASLEDLTQNIVENMWEDADTNDLNGLEELQAAIDAFNKANESIQMWEPDFTTAILVEKGN